MGIFDKIFGRQEKKQTSVHTNAKKTLPTIEEFPQLNSSDRMSVIMFVGDTGKAEYFSFLKYAILTDTDQNVKFAAFKRIHLFKENAEVVPMLTEIMAADKNLNRIFQWHYQDLVLLQCKNSRT